MEPLLMALFIVAFALFLAGALLPNRAMGDALLNMAALVFVGTQVALVMWLRGHAA